MSPMNRIFMKGDGGDLRLTCRVAGFGSHRELFAREAGYRRLVESYEKERASR